MVGTIFVLMFSQRWSTFSLLSIAMMVAIVAFLCGRHIGLVNGASSENTSQLPAVQIAPRATLQATQTSNSENQSDAERARTSWNRLAAMPGTPAVEEEMTVLVQKLAETDPQSALSLALAPVNLRLRAALLRAALKGWGEADPFAAVEWAKTQTVMDQSQIIAALLQGAVRNPSEAIDVTTQLMKDNVGRASEFGCDLISALNEGGEFELAANFAVNGPPNFREDLILPAYSRWAEFQPGAAVASAMNITDSAVRDSALNAITVGWSPTDPQGLLEFARSNLPMEQQNSVVTSALDFLASSDPVAAAKWINEHNPGSPADGGIAEIALSSQLSQTPEVAADWAVNISNSQLRMDTLATLVRKWMVVNPSNAKQFIQSSPILAPEDRSQLLAEVDIQAGQ